MELYIQNPSCLCMECLRTQSVALTVTQSSCLMVEKTRNERVWLGAIVAKFTVLSGTALEGLERTTK